MNEPTTNELLIELRENAATDVQFAQRVALVCCKLIATKQDPVAAIRTVFEIQ